MSESYRYLYEDLLGKPFRLGERGPEFYDCWGVCIEIAKRAGLKYPEDLTPEDTSDQDKAIHTVADRDFEKIEIPEPFCVVAFKITPPFTDHCGIVLPDVTHFVHIMRNHSVSKFRLDHRILAPRIEGFYRLKKNADS